MIATELSPFVGFPSIPRLFRDVVVTEKIDGTNASVHVLEDGQVYAASRTRYISPTEDNFGFAKWVEAHKDELRAGLGVGSHFGEWYGSGIQRGYGLVNGEKRFALFNTGRWVDTHGIGPLLEDKQAYAPECCYVVPVLWTGIFDTAAIAGVAIDLGMHGSKAVVGYNKPEGIVVYHTHSRQSFKYTLGDDGHKGK